jgi:hypothetical protein
MMSIGVHERYNSLMLLFFWERDCFSRYFLPASRRTDSIYEIEESMLVAVTVLLNFHRENRKRGILGPMEWGSELRKKMVGYTARVKRFSGDKTNE